MHKKLRIGLIGAGNVARLCHMKSFSNMENVEVVAVSNPTIEKAQAFAEEFGIPYVFSDYRDLLCFDNLDAVDICIANYLHAEIAIAAFARGLHVICEKPDAIHSADVEKMKMAAQQSGKVLMVMRNNRFMPISTYLKDYISEGKMGEIYAARCGWQRRRGVPGKGGWFTTKALSGGGPLIDLGVHMIDLTMWLMGNPKPVSVSGCTYRKFADSRVSDSADCVFGEKCAEGTFDVEDLAMGFIRFENGACMQIEFSWASNIEKEQRFFELRGTKAGASWSSATERLGIYTENEGEPVNIFPEIVNNAGFPMHEANLRHFVDVVCNGAEPIFVPQQGVDVIRILEAVYQSAETGREVLL